MKTDFLSFFRLRTNSVYQYLLHLALEFLLPALDFYLFWGEKKPSIFLEKQLSYVLDSLLSDLCIWRRQIRKYMAGSGRVRRPLTLADSCHLKATDPLRCHVCSADSEQECCLHFHKQSLLRVTNTLGQGRQKRGLSVSWVTPYRVGYMHILVAIRSRIHN